MFKRTVFLFVLLTIVVGLLSGFAYPDTPLEVEDILDDLDLVFVQPYPWPEPEPPFPWPDPWDPCPKSLTCPFPNLY